MSAPHVTAVVLLSGSTAALTPARVLDRVRAQTRRPDRLLLAVPEDLSPERREELEDALDAGHATLPAAAEGPRGPVRVLRLRAGTDRAEAVDRVLEALAPDGTDAAAAATAEPAAGDAPDPEDDAAPEGRRAAAVDVDALERRRTQQAEDLAHVPQRLRATRGRAGRRADLGSGDDSRWLWFVQDDAPPEADVLAAELDVLHRSPTTAVVGAKRVRPPETPGRGEAVELVDVGLTLTHAGRIITGVDPGEIDQGQADWRHDVLAVALPGMLVRERTLRRARGLDPALPAPWAEIDLCHRIWRAGERVAVQPTARVELAPPTRPLLDRLQEQRTGQLLVLLAHRSALAALLLLAVLPLVTLVRMAGAVAAVAPRRAGMEARAWTAAMARAPGVLRRGARARRRARVPRGRLAPLYLPRGESLRRSVADVWTRLVADDDRTRRIRRTTWGIAGTRHGIEDADYGRHVVGTVVVALSATVLGLVALRGLFGRGALIGPSLLVWPEDWRDAAESAWSSWIPGGLGERGPADPLVRLLGILPVDGGLLIEVLVFAAIPASALAAWWAAGAVTRAIGARLVLTVTWALAPVVLTALAAGAWPLLLVHVLLPVLALAVGRAIGLPHKVSQASVSAAAGGGLVLLLVGAVVPVLVPLVGIALALLAPLVPGRRARLLWVLLPSVLLHAPYLPVYLGHPATLFAVGAVPAPTAGASSGDLLRLWPVAPGLEGTLVPLVGETGAAWLPAVGVLAVVLGALAAPFLPGAAGRAGRYALLLAALGLGAVLIARSLVVAVEGDRAVTADLHAQLDLVLLALGLGAAAAFDALARREEGIGRARRALTGAVALGAAALSALTVAGWSLLLPGMLQVDRTTAGEVPAAAADQGTSATRARVLVLTEDADGTVGAGLVVHGGGSVLQRSAVTDARDVTAVTTATGLDTDAGSTALRDGVAALLATPSSTAVPPGAVGYVVVPGDVAEHPELVAALDASSALEKVTTTSTGGLWRVLGAPARAEVRAPDGTAVALDSSAIGASGSLEASGAERTLVLQERAESGWRAELDGRALEPVTVDGWAQGFVVPADAAGEVQVSRDQPWTLLWQVLLAVGVAGTALIAIPWRLRTRSAEDLYG